jgi:hypothetical protein
MRATFPAHIILIDLFTADYKKDLVMIFGVSCVGPNISLSTPFSL